MSNSPPLSLLLPPGPLSLLLVDGQDYGVGLLWGAVMDDTAPLKSAASEEALNAIVELIMRQQEDNVTEEWCGKTGE